MVSYWQQAAKAVPGDGILGFLGGLWRTGEPWVVLPGGMSSVTIDAESMRQTVAEAQQGDRVAADRLVREHASWVRSAIYAVTGRRDLVDDIAQQVWVRVWQRLGTLESPQRLRPWLYAVARNTALDARLAERRHEALTRAAAALAADGARPGPHGAVTGSELQATLLRAVQALPALYREPFVLRHLEEWSYAEIGDVLNLSVETVETRLVRARRLLREMLQGKVES
jgi:RNA polymerase sigma-70 factor (ECF subfamily)